MDDGFGNWLAGFIDGEGYFAVFVRTHRATVTANCEFRLRVRLDDAEVVQEIHRQTGIGRVCVLPRRENRPNENPLIEWSVASKAECAKLVRILDRYPLRAKKARDFAIWRLAVSEHATSRDIETMRAYRAQLLAIRVYDAAPVEVLEPGQLRLVS